MERSASFSETWTGTPNAALVRETDSEPAGEPPAPSPLDALTGQLQALQQALQQRPASAPEPVTPLHGMTLDQFRAASAEYAEQLGQNMHSPAWRPRR